jgi:hypothetical protein
MKYGLDFRDAARDFWLLRRRLPVLHLERERHATLLMNLRYYQLADRLEMPCIDVQYLFDQLVEQADMQRSIEYAIDFLDLPKPQPFHQAVNDAWYTGQIFRHIAEFNRTENNGTDLVARYAFDPNLNRSSQLTLGPLTSQEAIGPALDTLEAICPAAARLCGGTALGGGKEPLHRRVQLPGSWPDPGQVPLAAQAARPVFCLPVPQDQPRSGAGAEVEQQQSERRQ